MDEKLLGKCGFYCGGCPTYINGDCTGCVDAHKTGMCFMSIQLKAFLFLLDWIAVFLFAIFAAVNLALSVSQNKNLIQFLLNGSDAAGIFALNDIFDLTWQVQFFFLHNLVIFDDIDGDIVIDEAKDIEIQCFNRTFYF